MRNYSFYLIFFAFIFSSFLSKSQTKSSQEQAADRPKVGLVLSGGGAKGMAHVGAIKVLEEAGIVPDYITGTSMGALVGALYAIGYTADEMKELLVNMPWGEVLSDKIPLREITIEEKPYYGRYLVELPMEGIKVTLPRGVLEGQRLSELFSRLTLSVHDVDNFSDFPIPYTAVAVNLANGKPIDIHEGSLAEAMRASMSIPSVFTPVLTDSSTLLIDGGMARNFPVQEVKAMGADVVIGVDVGGGFTEPDKINTMVDVLVESTFLMSNLDSDKQRKLLNLNIIPDLTGYSVTDFNSSSQIIERGYQAALLKQDLIHALADSVYALRSKPPKPEKLPIENEFYFEKIRVAGNKEIPASYIEGKLNVMAGKKIKIDEIESNIELLYGTRYFSSITYEINSKNKELVIRVQEAPSAHIRPSMHFDTENGAGFILSYVHRNLFLPSSRLILEADFSEQPRIFFNYFKYLGEKQRFAAMLGVDYILNDMNTGIGEGSKRPSAVFRNSFVNPYIRLQTSQFQNWTVGIHGGWENGRLKPIVTTALEISDSLALDFNEIKRMPFNSLQFGAFAQLNTLDDPVFPNRGWYVNANIEQTAGTNFGVKYFSGNQDDEEFFNYFFDFFENTTRGSLQIQNYTPLSRKWNLQSELVAMFSSSDLLSPYDSYMAGGFYPLFKRSFAFWGADAYEYSINNGILIKEKGRYEILSNLYAEGLVNLMIPELDALNEKSVAQQSVLGYGVGVSYRSVLGPISLSVAHRHHSDRWYGFFSMGFNIK